MKKHTEGYVMIYVLVVMVLLALVATGVLSVSLNNYKAQQAVGQQMQELYTAEGIAEQAVAELGEQSGELVLAETIDGVSVPKPIETTALSPENVLAINKNTIIAAAEKFTEKIEAEAGAGVTLAMIEDDSLPVPDGSNRRRETIGAKLEPFGAVVDHEIVLPFSMTVALPEGNTEIYARIDIVILLSLHTRTEDKGDGTTASWLDGAAAKVTGTRFVSYEIKSGVAS